MNAKEIVKKYLIENGYDGLCAYDCGCYLEDLVPCGEDMSECVPGYKIIVQGDWFITSDKKELNGNNKL